MKRGISMKKFISAALGAAMPFLLSVTAFAGAPSPFEEFEEMMHTVGDFIIWVYIAGGAAALALIVGIIILVTGKKK